MNPKLKFAIGKNDRGQKVVTNAYPAPDWRDKWSLIAEIAGIQTNLPLELMAGKKAENRIWLELANLDPSKSLEEFNRRQVEHIRKIASGEYDISVRFTHTRQSVENEYRQHMDVLLGVLKLKIAENRPRLVDFLKSLVPPIRAVREKMEAEEVAKAEKHHLDFEPSSALKLLATAEQEIEFFAERVLTFAPENPTESVLRDLLPNHNFN